MSGCQKACGLMKIKFQRYMTRNCKVSNFAKKLLVHHVGYTKLTEILYIIPE